MLPRFTRRSSESENDWISDSDDSEGSDGSDERDRRTPLKKRAENSAKEKEKKKKPRQSPAQARSMPAQKAKKILTIDKTAQFSVIWSHLKKEGWSHKTGPEPFNKVYVPPGGSVRMGSRDGVDFYSMEEGVWAYARVKGLVGGDHESQDVGGVLAASSGGRRKRMYEDDEEVDEDSMKLGDLRKARGGKGEDQGER